MTTKTLEKIKQDVDLLKSVVFGFIGRDPEGEYKPKFVRRVLRLAKHKPTHEFTTAKDFLKTLQQE